MGGGDNVQISIYKLSAFFCAVLIASQKLHRVERIDCDEPKLSVTKLIDPSEINLSYRRRSIQPKVGALYRSFRQTILKFSRLCSRLCSDLGINTTFAVEIPPCSKNQFVIRLPAHMYLFFLSFSSISFLSRLHLSRLHLEL